MMEGIPEVNLILRSTAGVYLRKSVAVFFLCDVQNCGVRLPLLQRASGHECHTKTDQMYGERKEGKPRRTGMQ